MSENVNVSENAKNETSLEGTSTWASIAGVLTEMKFEEGETSNKRKVIKLTCTIDTGDLENPNHIIVTAQAWDKFEDKPKTKYYDSIMTAYKEYKPMSQLEDEDYIREIFKTMPANEATEEKAKEKFANLSNEQKREIAFNIATKVQAINCRFDPNTYVSNDEVKFVQKFTANCFSSTFKKGYEPKAIITIDRGYVESIKPETAQKGEDREETGRGIMTLLLPVTVNKDYPTCPIERVEVYLETVNDTDWYEAVQDAYEKGQTGKFYLSPVNRKIETVRYERKMGGGQREVKSTTYKNELILVDGNDPYDEDIESEAKKIYSSEAIRNALSERTIWIENEKKKKNEPKTNNTQTSNSRAKGNLGF